MICGSCGAELETEEGTGRPVCIGCSKPSLRCKCAVESSRTPKAYDGRVVKNIPVEFHGKVIGVAELTASSRLQVVFNDDALEDHIRQILELGLVTRMTLDFEYIPAVRQIVKNEE